jgi:hypothetical protein
VAVSADGEPVSAMGTDFRDINNDGLPDIFFTALPDETFPLFLNKGTGWFDEATYSYGLTLITRTMAGWGAGLYDSDNDGWKDVFVSRSEVLSSTGSMATRAKQPNSVFRNNSGKDLQDLTAVSGLGAARQMYRGAAFGDFNGDGRIDVVVSALNAPAEIWLNSGAAAGNWIALRLEGTRSNRSAIGAKVKLTTASGAQFNHATASVGYASSSAGPLHFGLGAADIVREVEIAWPSGTVQRMTGLRAGRILSIREPASEPSQ